MSDGFGVGMPATLHLDIFGSVLWDAFGQPAYLVGSALTGAKGQWRDVDIRLIMDDEEYDAMFAEHTQGGEHRCGKWVALCMAFSALGKQMTGLPIDFQIQKQSMANTRFDNPRSAIGLVPMRMMRKEATDE